MCFPALLNLMMPIWTGKKGGKGGRETEKAKIFVTLSLNKRGDSQYPKMSITKISSRLPQNALPKISLRRGYTTGR